LAGPKYVKVEGTAQVGVVGDYAKIFNYLLQPKEELASYIRARDFKVIVDDRTRDFVGRDFVFDGIDVILEDRDFPSGYIVIQGEPGIGKTAVLSEFIKRSACVHHFHSIGQNIRSAEAFLSNVCAQLMIRYEIDEPLPARALSDAGYLTGLLDRVADDPDRRPVIVAVDALDEADHAHGLSLPTSLPDGVFFVVTMREGTSIALGVDRSREIFIRESDPLHLRDVLSYIRRFIDDRAGTMVARIDGWGVDRETFTDALVKRSEGNFMYLKHVLRDINSGLISPATIENVQKLPIGLRNYYALHWREMKSLDPAKFTNYQQPVICLLTAAREPVSQNEIVEWTRWLWNELEDPGEIDPVAVKSVIDEWRAFLNVQDPDDETPRYRVYHASLGDFVRSDIGVTRYHKAIAQFGKSKIPSLSAA
jgi:hypothetical protein